MQEKVVRENSKEDQMQIYEIGYLLVSSIPQEKVETETTTLKEVLSKKGAVFMAEEAPELRTLAYTMVKKIGTVNHKFDQGFFGWFKFELAKKEIESVKKAFEENPNMLRTLIINTVKEVTYLGKKAAVASIIKSEDIKPEEVATAEIQPEPATETPIVPPVVTSASIEEMDKSIDEMVKGA